jgi:hypothetical protein
MEVKRPQPRQELLEESSDSGGRGVAIVNYKLKGVQPRQGGGDRGR